MVRKNYFKIRDLTYIAVIVAIIAVCSQISIPLPHGVPLTMQVFAVSLAGVILTPVHSLVCITVYIIAGALGVPVFANFSAGIGKLVGPTGGFIYGFYFLVIFLSIFKNQKLIKRIFIFTFAAAVFHLTGALHYSFVMNTDFITSLVTVTLPFFVKDLASVFVADYCGKVILSRIKIRNI